MNLRNMVASLGRVPVGKHGPALLCAIIFQFLLLGPRSVHAAKVYPSAGNTSAAFLKLGAGARALGMGGAFAGVSGDPYAIYWNPAGLSVLDDQKHISLFHNDYFQGLSQQYLLYTTPAAGTKLPLLGTMRGGAWGFGLDYFSVPKDLERRSGLNEADPLNPISPVEGKFGAYDLAFTAAYGWKPSPGLGLGAGLKVIRQSIDDKAGSSLALDLGLLRAFAWRGGEYTAGFSAQNIGPGIKFADKRYGLPLVFRAGLSRRFLEDGALFSLEADRPVDNYLSLAFGAEYPVTNRLALRAGYRYRQHGNELGPWTGLSAGAGIAFDRFSFDYAFTPFGGLGNAHRFSLSVKFGGEGKGKAAPVQAAALANSKPAVYEVSSRSLGISPQGVNYHVSAASPASDLYSFSFRTLIRGGVPAALAMLEGDIPRGPAAPLPRGFAPLKVWEPAGLPGSLQSGLRIEFKLRKSEATKEKAAFLYGNGQEWKEAAMTFLKEDQDFCYFSVEVPVAEYYAAAARE